MATRDRTKLFNQFRKDYEHQLNFGSNYKSNLDKNEENQELLELEAMGLILTENSKNGNGRTNKTNKDYVEISMEHDLPKWVEIKDEISEDMERIHKNLDKLETLHKKRLRPGFSDRSLEEKAIMDLTEQITSQLKRGHGMIQQLGERHIMENNEVVVKNARISLATKLQDTSNRLRTDQTNYVTKLRQRESTGGDLIQLANESSNSFLEDETDFQLVQKATYYSQEEELIATREREIDRITESISQLADLFRSLQSIVIEQGTLLDRIDYNVEQMALNVRDAANELQTAVSYQRNDKSKYCIYLLVALIVLMIILIMIKSASRRKS